MNRRTELKISPVKALKKSELVAKELRNQIMRGDLKEGDSLPAEADLLRQFGISRPTLREALRILEADSLVTVLRGAHGGPVVHLPGPEIAARHFGLVLQAQDTELSDVFRARQLIEPPAVRIVVEEANKKALDVLREVVDQEWRALEKGDIVLLSHYSTRFHEGIVSLTGNKTLLLIMQILNSVYFQHMSAEYMAADAGFDNTRVSRLSIQAHEHLIDLIEAGDADAAANFWRDHLSKVRKTLFKDHQFKRVIDLLD